MRFASLLAVVAVATNGASAVPGWTIQQATGFDLSLGNHYGSPTPPWKPSNKPGWYYGNNPGKYPGIPCLTGIICLILPFFPKAIQCPHKPPSPPHTTTTHKTTSTTKPTSTTPTSTITPTPTPTPTNGYLPTFSNITAAVQADDYQTFGLVGTIQDCLSMCDSVAGCAFVNTYHDVNGKGGSTDLTCSLFTKCHTAADADNAGGQSQPDGSVNFIINSDGWCKI